MPAWLNGALRAALQVVWAWLVTQAAARGFHLPAEVPDWLAAAVFTGATAVVVGAIQWAERQPDTPAGRALRWLARLLMLGLRPAIYPKLPAGYVPPKA